MRSGIERAMVSTIEAKKATLVHKAAALAGQLFDPADQATANRFIAQFYEHVPPADVAERTPRNLYGAALSLWRFGERRRPGQAKIRVHNPDPAADGWSSPHTIVEIVNDDMPFLVDSVTGAINASNRVVHLIIHPILTVARGPDGRLCDILEPGAAGTRESWMQIEITSEADPADLARLTQTLSGVLADVRAAVTDWQPMRQVLREVAAELSAQPPPVPAAELAEAQDFLSWLDDDNFTFLGYREYFFDGAAKPEHGPLGILRDEAHSVFGGLRDLSSLPSDVQDFVRRRELLVITKSNRRGTVHRTAHMDAIGVRRFGANGDVTGVRVFLGFFTSLAYSRSSRSIPLLRLKVRRIVERSGASPASHDGKALLHILDTFPRDELFQADEDQLFDTVTGILNLQERQRIAVFVRRDPLERFVSCFVYVPRERYDSQLRSRFGAILEEAFAGQISTFHTHLDELALARIHFIIRTTRGAVPSGRHRRPGRAARRSGTQLDGPAPSGGGDGFRRRGGACPAAPLSILPDRLSGTDGRCPSSRGSASGSRLCRQVPRSKSRSILPPMRSCPGCGSIGRKNRSRSPTCCRCSRTSVCAWWPKNRSGSTAPTARQCGFMSFSCPGSLC